MLVLKRLIAFLVTSVTLLIAGAALAASGQPEPWQFDFQQSATPVPRAREGLAIIDVPGASAPG